MDSRTQILLILLAAVAVWAGALHLLGPEPSWALLKPFGFTSGAVTLLAIGFTKWVWKWRMLRGWIVNRPNLTGTWRAELQSTYTVAGQRVIKKGFMVIKQDLLHLSIRLYTDQAYSYSISQDITVHKDGFFDVACVYLNVPEADLRATQQSQIHHGALLISHFGHDESRLEGLYWTDRQTMGNIVLSDRHAQLVTSHTAGVLLYS